MEVLRDLKEAGVFSENQFLFLSKQAEAKDESVKCPRHCSKSSSSSITAAAVFVTVAVVAAVASAVISGP